MRLPHFSGIDQDVKDSDSFYFILLSHSRYQLVYTTKVVLIVCFSYLTFRNPPFSNYINKLQLLVLIKLPHMTKFLASIVISLVAGCLWSSCSIIRVVEIASPTADCAGSGQHFCHDTTIRSSIWKSKNKVNFQSTCATGISRVKITTKPMDVVLGFITLGFLVQQRIDWDCAQRTGSDDIR